MCGKCGEREPNHTTTVTANSTTDVPTVVKTTHPIPEHAQPGKKILTIKHSRNIAYPKT